MSSLVHRADDGFLYYHGGLVTGVHRQRGHVLKVRREEEARDGTRDEEGHCLGKRREEECDAPGKASCVVRAVERTATRVSSDGSSAGVTMSRERTTRRPTDDDDANAGTLYSSSNRRRERSPRGKRDDASSRGATARTRDEVRCHQTESLKSHQT